MKEAFELD
jgi:hypothetical protein